ncbi:MAG: ATP-binding cassette domain-containing protein [Bryobacterales bacterium]|nr:ATP-binding cassette domain-containing protein [Bryobacterales bacterium]
MAVGSGPPLLDFRQVSVARGVKRVLDRVTLRVGPGEHVAILGPNGCGKSTFIKTLTRECYPLRTDDPWSLEVLGRKKWHVFELRSHMGIVSNDLMAACTRDYSAREIVLSGFFSSVGVWPNHEVTPEMQSKTDEVLERLGIAHLADRPVEELSTGEGRRVLLGRALVHDPGALVLDEPTQSLDLRALRDIRSAMRTLAQAGTTIVLVTHTLADIIPEIGRVILLRDGRVFQDGPKEEILTEETLGALFGTEVHLIRRDGFYDAI